MGAWRETLEQPEPEEQSTLPGLMLLQERAGWEKVSGRMGHCS